MTHQSHPSCLMDSPQQAATKPSGQESSEASGVVPNSEHQSISYSALSWSQSLLGG